ncbi:hypothetical protein TNCV_248991 [Trichonephila clavipes]|nr:hypothetical protein TNCV_248991 [Trichonephila clavipes]
MPSALELYALNARLPTAIIGILLEEVVHLAWQINLKVHCDDVQELLESQWMNLKKFQQQDIKELESLDPIQLEDRMMVGNSTKSLRKRILNFRNYELQ